MTLPLEGLLVLELGVRTGASLCGSLLSQLGAEVVFVEQAPRVAVPEHKLAHRPCFAAGKLSLVPDDGSLLARLAQAADVVLTSSDLDPPLPELPADWRESRIVCDLTAYGATGPLAGRADGERQMQALLRRHRRSTGMPDGPPVPIHLPIVEFMTGVYAAAAVRRGAARAATGRRRPGDRHGALRLRLRRDGDLPAARCSTAAGRPSARVGNRHAMTAPWNVYRADDGWMLICVGSDAQWQRLCGDLDRPELRERSALRAASPTASRAPARSTAMRAARGSEAQARRATA